MVRMTDKEWKDRRDRMKRMEAKLNRIASELWKEIVRLKQELAKVTEERNELRAALRNRAG